MTTKSTKRSAKTKAEPILISISGVSQSPIAFRIDADTGAVTAVSGTANNNATSAPQNNNTTKDANASGFQRNHDSCGWVRSQPRICNEIAEGIAYLLSIIDSGQYYRLVPQEDILKHRPPVLLSQVRGDLDPHADYYNISFAITVPNIDDSSLRRYNLMCERAYSLIKYPGATTPFSAYDINQLNFLPATNVLALPSMLVGCNNACIPLRTTPEVGIEWIHDLECLANTKIAEITKDMMFPNIASFSIRMASLQRCNVQAPRPTLAADITLYVVRK